MSKVVWHITMSVDGYIAGPDDEMGWMGDYELESPVGAQVIESTGSILAGRRWHDLAIERWNGRHGIYGGHWSGPVFVITHEPPTNPPDPEITFVSEGIEQAIATALEAAGGVTSASSAPGRGSRPWPPASWTSSSFTSCPYCWAAGSDCSGRSRTECGWSGATSVNPPRPRTSATACCAEASTRSQCSCGAAEPRAAARITLGLGDLYMTCMSKSPNPPPAVASAHCRVPGLPSPSGG